MENTRSSIITLSCSLLLICNILLCLNPQISSVVFLPTSPSSALGNKTDRIALLNFKSLIEDPLGMLSSWNDSLHFCQWYGVTCSKRHQRITVLDLNSQKLTGQLSPHIGNLTFLKIINLENNSFFGHIPLELGHLFRLQQLHLVNNSFQGEIPGNLSSCSHLREMNLGFNRLFGEIPSNLGSLSKLVKLFLRSNNLSGGIPSSLGNLSSLEILSLATNQLGGNVPDSLGRLSSLNILELGPNQLSGIIPPSLYNLSSLTKFSLIRNQLYGILPQYLGLKLPNLQIFSIDKNQFSGTIPVSFLNASQLSALYLGGNRLSGSVPINLGTLASLQVLSVGSNRLGTGEVDDLSFLNSLTNCSHLKMLDLQYNNFGGQLPNSIANLSNQLERVYIGGNRIFGSIPTNIANLVNLDLLAMESNLLTGTIPISTGKLQNLQVLNLANNKLTGEIPSSIGNITQVYALHLAINHLNGSIPPHLQYCQHLQELYLCQNELDGNIPVEVIALPSLIAIDLSDNSLTGSLPSELGKLKSLGLLNISHNKLFGKIPGAIGDCLGLEALFMQKNYFNGSMPSSIASLKGIKYLDLSSNNLSGKIPQDLKNLSFIESLNLSFNNLEGMVPVGGVFNNSSTIFVTGNNKLCGGIPSLKLPPCPKEVIKKHGRSNAFKVIVTLICVALFSTLVVCFLIFHWQRKSRKDPPPIAFLGESYIRVSYEDLLKATDGFAPANLIGTSTFGAVYKGTLPQEEKPVAVKILNLQHKVASKSFMIECEALKRIRHRNLVKIITSCSSVDFKGNDFKALVFELMANGSLENCLHPSIDGWHQSRKLNLEQRLNIAIDIASALDYLHNHCEAPLVHRDLKASNVLLDDDMTSHVGDFGLAKFLPKTSSSFSNNLSTSVAVNGSIGYIAPEYGIGGEASTKGDVYSYGILLLEMFTGKRPTDDMFINDSSLHEYSKMALPEHIMEIIDLRMLIPDEEREQDEAMENMENFTGISHGMRDCLVSIVRIGVACSMDSPRDRMDIQDVVHELHSIKNIYLKVTDQEESIIRNSIKDSKT